VELVLAQSSVDSDSSRTGKARVHLAAVVIPQSGPDHSRFMSAAFRAAMADVPTPVTVVTSLDEARPHGTTVSAFTSLSLDPMMILVCLDRSSNLLRVVECTRRFGVNILGRDQSHLAMVFARKGDDKFTGVDWTFDHGLPRLGGSPVWIACSVADLSDGGDHVIVLGAIEAVRTIDVPPLTYHRRVFGTHQPEPI
jgi:flavin reductase (DIM6/NTAB) family NADH-FMN oxidoreductase RutF